ncbi:MAG: transaldolase [Azoarcus sp.]|jgi:transaldolase|nr:transaldolase [Azoarcus sp.]
MNPLLQIRALGQQVWLDNLSRTLLDSGELARLVSEDGIAGVTTNPAIFQKAIASGAYESELACLKQPPLTAEGRYERLAIADVQRACDLLRPLFEQSRGNAGYVSLEVSPALAHDAESTVAAGRRLVAQTGRPNLLIKIPGTRAGLDAVECLTGEGININVTLLFSPAHAQAAADAYVRGLERLRAAGGALERSMSVASVFLSRVDALIDTRLEAAGGAALALRGQAAVAMARLAYRAWRERFQGSRFAALRTAGARPQYLLWASTGTKNPAYSDLLYVEPLVGAETVTTLPDATLAALRDHGRVKEETLPRDFDAAQALINQIAAYDIHLNEIGETLQADGLKQFEQAFAKLLEQTG